MLVMQLFSCLTAGTHGSIKAYDYSVSKNVLQKAIEKVIAESADIHRDSTKNYIIDVTNGKNDTIIDNQYNDGIEYLTINIDNNGKGKGTNKYIFQYGTEGNEDTAKTSFISIAYGYDKNGHGGIDGNGGVAWYRPFLKKKLINLFEEKLINRIDKELGENTPKLIRLKDASVSS